MADSAYQEWLDGNSRRRFPLEDDSDLSCVGGGTLPESLVLDARICLFGTSDGPARLLSAAVTGPGRLSLSLELPWRIVDLEAAYAEGSPFGVASHSSREASIRIVTGRPDAGEAGIYALRNPPAFAAGRVLSVPYGIGADTLSAGGVTATGVVRVEDGVNTTLHVRGNSLVLDVGKGLGKGVACREREGSGTCEGRVLYYLAGQKADPDGSLAIYGGDGVAVSTGTFRGIPAVIVHPSRLSEAFLGGARE